MNKIKKDVANTETRSPQNRSFKLDLGSSTSSVQARIKILEETELSFDRDLTLNEIMKAFILAAM